MIEKLSEPDGRLRAMDMLRIDCGTCAVRGPACADCMVTALLGPNEGTMDLDTDEVSALQAMTSAGLLPPLRLVRTVSRRPPPEGEGDWFASGKSVI